MKNPLLSAEKVTKNYQSGNTILEVLKGVDLSLNEGEIAVLLGASGSGKSTLLNILAGIDKPDSGKVYLNNDELTSFMDNRLTKKRNRELGFVFQFHHLLKDFTVLENVMLPGLIAGTDIKKVRIKAMELLEELGLPDRASHKPGEISGGEAQRVAVARALINNPRIVFADEPTGNLDRANGEVLLNLLMQLNQRYRLTFLIATHNEELLEQSRQLLLKDGIIHEN
ncbi:MAG: ATP-binding cassette domain-containing protein [candidate division Zixibacteria bacterium]|nr:ATP-binding cassette domain-containing protein [candidate division Zixibacteria bacterium]